jgi:formate dehydrogenase-N alpha subunit
MTNHWNDIANADVIMICGANPASNHPVSFKHILEARRRGARVITVDPRFTRTANRSDLYCKLRPGSDVAFVGGLILYVIQRETYNKDYVRRATNAPFLIRPDYGFNEGIFSGYDPGTRSYDTASWSYQLDETGIPRQDPTLEDPNCVFQILKRHFARYTPEVVSNVVGCDEEDFLAVAEAFAESGKPGKAGTILYAMGLTQHTLGTQNIRGWAILQLLLGNVGVAGGGVNALRGESNVQGSTDFALLFHILPGYLQSPMTADQTLTDYLQRCTPRSSDPASANWWSHTPAYIVSLLRAFWGPAATGENDYGFNWLPKRTANYSHIAIFEAMSRGRVKGAFFMGQNPAVGGPDSDRETSALGGLDWMVCADLWQTETANFWRNPDVKKPGDIRTEVFLLPAAASFEKEGSITNSGRWAQWRTKAVEPPGMARSDLWFMDRLARELKRLYTKKGGAFPEPIVNLSWDYGGGEDGIDVHRVAREINGYEVDTARLVSGFTALEDDGTTACGNWLYSGSYTEAGNQMARRDPTDAPNKIGLYPGWSWCWPANRRILYNRASVDRQGRPSDEEHWVIRWDWKAREGRGAWIGDVPDGGWPPGEKRPFIMRPEGVACLFASCGLADGPLPEHYEPVESPVRNRICGVQNDPVAMLWQEPEQEEENLQGFCRQYPIIATTFRLSEHWQAGQMTRNIGLLNELMPAMFVMISPGLAGRLGVKNGERVVVSTPRGELEAFAHVTARIQPYRLKNRWVEVVALPWHFGFIGKSTGEPANRLTAHVGDANTGIPEYKTFQCNVRKGGQG